MPAFVGQFLAACEVPVMNPTRRRQASHQGFAVRRDRHYAHAAPGATKSHMSDSFPVPIPDGDAGLEAVFVRATRDQVAVVRERPGRRAAMRKPTYFLATAYV